MRFSAPKRPHPARRDRARRRRPGPAGRADPHSRLLLFDPAGELTRIIVPWRDRVDVVTGKLEGATAGALLVRPDCFVAWSADDPETPRTALNRFFGEPAPP
jgi:hypothetical protein